MTRFAVAILARETRSVLERFITHYKRVGAASITIYFDGATDHLADLNDAVTTLVTCDEAFWQGQGCRQMPRLLDHKLEAIFRDAMAKSAQDWLLLVDADEFLVSTPPLTDVLSGIPVTTDVLSIPNLEAVWGPRDPLGAEFAATYLRKPASRGLHKMVYRAIYGAEVSGLMQRGLAGHSAGKQAIRTGRRYDRITSHHTERDGVMISAPLDEIAPDADTFIAHFDAISLERWREKFRIRYSGETPSDKMMPNREEQMRLIQNAAKADDTVLTALFRRLYHLSPLQYATLRAAGLAVRQDVFAP